MGAGQFCTNPGLLIGVAGPDLDRFASAAGAALEGAAAGQMLTARVRSTTSYERGTNVAWAITVRDAAGRQLSHQSLDLEKGFLP